MKPTTVPMFDEFEDENSTATTEDTDEWKRILVLALTNKQRLQVLKKVIGGELGARAKHYDKVAMAITDAVRFKSTDRMAAALGPRWEELLREVKPLDRFHDSLQVWLETERTAEEDEGVDE